MGNTGAFDGKNLSIASLLRTMDWQNGKGEENEGVIGSYINFGGIGKRHVVNTHTNPRTGETVYQDDVFLILNPQNYRGMESSIVEPLSEMVAAAGDRPVVLVNPDLTDRASSQGQQGVRGRKARQEFAASFQTVYHFQNIYVSGTSFPILGAMCKLGPTQAWIAHQRRDLLNKQGEVYLPVLSSEEKPDGQIILSTFER